MDESNFDFDEALSSFLGASQSPKIEGAFADFLPIFKEVRGLANTERTALVDDGWSEENAQAVAADVYSFLLTLILKTADTP